MLSRTFVSLTAVGLVSSAVACSSDDSSNSVATTGDAGTPDSSTSGAPSPDAGTSSAPTPEASSPDAAASGASTPDASSPGTFADGASSDSGSAAPDAGSSALVRVAHLSPDAPAVDFCIAAHGTTSFSGPVLKGASLTAGISYPSVTEYLPVPPGQYDVRLVAPNAADCSTSLAGLPDFKSLPALPANASVTIAAEGQVSADAGVPFGLTAYVDDATAPAGKASLRFVHASPGTPPVDVGTSAGATFSAVFSDVAFGAVAAAAGPIDANGYLQTAPLSDVELSARAHGAQTDVLVIPSASLPAGAVATAFAIGKLGNTKTPLEVLLCVDNAAPTAGLSSCSQVGDSLSHLRVAHLSPDAPAVDVCLKSHASATWPAKPLLNSLGASAGLSYPQVTTYVDVPVDAYDVRIVLATATDCSAGAVPDTSNVQVTAGLSATVAAIGDLTVAGSDPAFSLKVFPDDRTVDPAKAKLRFIHASPSTPAVDVGVGTGASFMKLFADVAFGATAAAGASIDADGYLSTAPVSGVNVTARVANATTDALTVPGISLPAGTIATTFAIGGKTGQATNPLQVLICTDSAPANGVLTACLAPKP
ncbi:MAG: DUF4397 domain-containing protein [Polyangiaceae bacterium]